MIFKYLDYNVNGWAIISDTLNSMRLNGREITHEIPVFGSLFEDTRICFNYINGQTIAPNSNDKFRIKEFIVFDQTLSDENRRCAEEYIYDKHTFWQNLQGLAPYNDYIGDLTFTCRLWYGFMHHIPD